MICMSYTPYNALMRLTSRKGRVEMENVGFLFGIFGLMLGVFAIKIITVLEKNLKETGVLDKEFDSKKEGRK